MSVIAIASWEYSIEYFNKSDIFDVDWSTENWVYEWRWPNLNSCLFISAFRCSLFFSTFWSFFNFLDSSNKSIWLISGTITLERSSLVSSSKISLLFTIELGWIFFSFNNLNKHNAVASTSADALWADSNFSLNKCLYSSIRVGNLNFLPLPPVSIHIPAVSSVHVSIFGKSWRGLVPLDLKYSEPRIFSSKFRLWPHINSDLSKSSWNLSRTKLISTPIFFPSCVEIPWIFSESYGIENPSG